jgi:hypothetical protein
LTVALPPPVSGEQFVVMLYLGFFTVIDCNYKFSHLTAIDL